MIRIKFGARRSRPRRGTRAICGVQTEHETAIFALEGESIFDVSARVTKNAGPWFKLCENCAKAQEKK